MNSEEKKTIALAAADFLITNQLTLLRLTDKADNMTLCIPSANGINEEDLKEILRNKLPTDNFNFKFEYIGSTAANGTTIIHINKID